MPIFLLIWRWHAGRWQRGGNTRNVLKRHCSACNGTKMKLPFFFFFFSSVPMFVTQKTHVRWKHMSYKCFERHPLRHLLCSRYNNNLTIIYTKGGFWFSIFGHAIMWWKTVCYEICFICRCKMTDYKTGHVIMSVKKTTICWKYVSSMGAKFMIAKLVIKLCLKWETICYENVSHLFPPKVQIIRL